MATELMQQKIYILKIIFPNCSVILAAKKEIGINFWQQMSN